MTFQQPQIPESYGRNKWPSCSCFADKSVFRVRMKPSENSDFNRKSSNHAPDCSDSSACDRRRWCLIQVIRGRGVWVGQAMQDCPHPMQVRSECDQRVMQGSREQPQSAPGGEWFTATARLPCWRHAWRWYCKLDQHIAVLACVHA
eukprot:COSAG01_NODE_27591_length_681_cov_11.637457_1_plen_145_part_10